MPAVELVRNTHEQRSARGVSRSQQPWTSARRNCRSSVEGWANSTEGGADVSRRWRLPPTALAGLAVAAVLVPGPSAPPASAADPVARGPVPRAHCGPGSAPELGIQGRVSRADRDNGRSRKGYRCNLELVGQYQGQGTTWVSQSFKTCAYHSQAFPASVAGKAPGVHVIDVRDPAHPR